MVKFLNQYWVITWSFQLKAVVGFKTFPSNIQNVFTSSEQGFFTYLYLKVETIHKFPKCVMISVTRTFQILGFLTFGARGHLRTQVRHFDDTSSNKIMTES